MTNQRSFSLSAVGISVAILVIMPLSYGQHGMPIPTCPARGLVAPGKGNHWYLDGCYGCPWTDDLVSKRLTNGRSNAAQPSTRQPRPQNPRSKQTTGNQKPEGKMPSTDKLVSHSRATDNSPAIQYPGEIRDDETQDDELTGNAAEEADNASEIDAGEADASEADEGDEMAEEEQFRLLPDSFHEYGGITAEYIYTGEFFSIAHGGFNTNRGTKYRGNLDIVLMGDSEAMKLWKGGRFFVYGNSYHGQCLTNNYVGDAQVYTNIDSTPRSANEFLLMEYWYEHAFADGDIVVKIGKQDANADFAFVDLGGDFVNSSFGFAPTIPLSTWPNTGMGAAVFLNLTDEIHFKSGVYDGATFLGPLTGGRNGLTNLGQSGALNLNELSFTPQLGSNNDLPGTYKIGAWLHSGNFDNLATGTGTFNGSWGYWANADQLLWKEPGSDEEPQGLGIFLQYGWAPTDRSFIDDYYGTGITYRGPIKGRDVDLFGLGLASAGFSTAGSARENAIEMFYKAQVTSWATVQPDLVYISHPSGTGNDAFLVGLRTEIVF